MKECKCERNSYSIIAGSMTRYELTDDRHTKFFILRCNGCEGFFAFPPENFNLAMEEGTPETLKKIAELTNY